MIVKLLSLILIGSVWAKDFRTVKCDESRVVPIFVRPNFGTIINFPIKPDHVLLGGSKEFGVEYIKNDIAITALTSNANTNMFVYLFGRRCGFSLRVTHGQFDNVIRVRDPDENKIKVKIDE